MSLFGPDRPKYLLSSNLSTFDHHRQHIKSRAWGLSDLSSPLGLVLPNPLLLYGVLVYTPPGYPRLRRGLVTPLEIWSKAFQISSGRLIWSVFVELGRFSPARRGIFPDGCPTGEGSMQCRKNPDGDPESLGPYLISCPYR